MPKVIIKVPGAPDREIELAPGPHKVGRSVNTDLQIDHPSVSGSHCELMATVGTITVRDLGSTNGLSLDGQRVQECEFMPGHSLRLGEAEITYGIAAPRLPDLPVAATPRAPSLVPPKRLRRSKNFYKSIPGAFLYSCKRNGVVLLASGGLLCAGIDFVLNFHVGGLALLGLVFGGACAGYVTGYLFLYLQTIVIATGAGEDNMPSWPDYEGWWDSAIEPYVRLLAICAACAAPAVLFLWYAGNIGRVLFAPLLIVGFFFAPMAFLAVTVDDSLMALNPMLVIPSIFRVPREYTACCLLLGGFLLARDELIELAEWLYRRFSTPPPFTLPVVGPGQINHHFLSDLAGIFLMLYFAVLAARLLGLLYYCKKEELGWRV